MELLKSEFEELDNLLISCEIDSGLSIRCLNQYLKLTRRIQPRDALMLESMLISGVSGFEAFISNLITASLRFDPSPMSKGGRVFEYNEVINFESIADFIEDASDKYVDNLMRDPLEKWLDFLSMALRIRDLAWIKDDLNEYLQRRHVLVHNGGRVSRAYLEHISGQSNLPKLHDKLTVDLDYLTRALNKMAQVVLFLSQAALSAVQNSATAKRDGFSGDDIGGNDTAFDCLLDGRFGVISESCAKIEPFFWVSVSKEYFKANCWHARKMMKGIEEIRREVELWDVSLNDTLLLAKHCLLENVTEAKKVLDRLLAAQTITSIEFATWPILEPLRRVPEAS